MRGRLRMGDDFATGLNRKVIVRVVRGTTPVMTTNSRSWAAARVELLRWTAERRNPDGGWGYRAGRPNRLEPTGWALLARRTLAGPEDELVLQRWKTRDGLLVEGPSGAVNLAFAGLAALAWLGLSQGKPLHALDALVTALTKERGVRLPPSREVLQDNQMQGWPWVSGTFTWVEPTAWCLLALKRWRASGAATAEVRARIDEGEAVLIDRALPTGGWNYGNPLVYGKVLQPFVPTTALALLALRDRARAPEVSRGLEWLRTNRLSEPSPSALAWAAIGLRAFGVDAADLRDRLLRHVEPGLVENDLVAAAQVAEGLEAGREGDPFAV